MGTSLHGQRVRSTSAVHAELQRHRHSGVQAAPAIPPFGGRQLPEELEGSIHLGDRVFASVCWVEGARGHDELVDAPLC